MQGIGHNLPPEKAMLEWLREVYETPTLNTSVKVIATAIYLRWDYEKNTCAITFQEIALLTSQHINTVQKHCEKLKNFSLNFVPSRGKKKTIFSKEGDFNTHQVCNKDPNYTPDVQKRSSNYTSSVQKETSNYTPDVYLEQKGCLPVAKRVTDSRKKGVCQSPNPIIEPINEPKDMSVSGKTDVSPKSKKRKRHDYSGRFEKFWRVYSEICKKTESAAGAKAEAWSEWSKLDDQQHGHAEKGLRHYVSECRESSQYMKHCCRYLSKMVWEAYEDKLLEWWEKGPYEIDFLRQVIAEAKPNGHWPRNLGPAPGHAESPFTPHIEELSLQKYVEGKQ